MGAIVHMVWAGAAAGLHAMKRLIPLVAVVFVLVGCDAATVYIDGTAVTVVVSTSTPAPTPTATRTSGPRVATTGEVTGAFVQRPVEDNSGTIRIAEVRGTGPGKATLSGLGDPANYGVRVGHDPLNAALLETFQLTVISDRTGAHEVVGLYRSFNTGDAVTIEVDCPPGIRWAVQLVKAGERPPLGGGGGR